jgi:hypothetical protein
MKHVKARIALASLILISAFSAVPDGSHAWGCPTALSSLNPERGEQNQSMPLGSLLGPDGTLNLDKGFSGSVNPSGWKMELGSGGKPRFVTAGLQTAPALSDPADEAWDGRFSLSGVDNIVYAISVSGTDVYVGGLFSIAGNIQANNIAKWDGTAWSALGNGTSYIVRAIAVSGSRVFVGGDFSEVGDSIPANHIAMWDGANWSPLGSGMESAVYALAATENVVYAGGIFESPGRFFAKWDGSAWSAMGSLGSEVYAIAVAEGDVYIEGGFATGGLHKWNGTGWDVVGGGVNGRINAFAVQGTDLYMAGQFTMVGNLPANNVAKWDGSNWSTLGAGTDGPIGGIAVNGNAVYVCGGFHNAGGVPVSNAAKWDGSTWSALGGGIPGQIANAVGAVGDAAYFGGAFLNAGGVATSYVAKWNGESWAPMTSGSGVSYTVAALVSTGDSIYAAGGFDSAGGAFTNSIGRWDGNEWSALGQGVPYSATNDSIELPVYALAMLGSDLYVGGNFYQAGGVDANGIARWDGRNWSAVGGSVFYQDVGAVYAMTVSGSDLYVGGYFLTAGGHPANYIARWDGQSWSALGTGLNQSVRAIAVNGSIVYAGGEFTRAGDVTVNHIAKWDGTTWSPLGAGTDLSVNSLAISGGLVYAGGAFRTAGGLSVNHIASWDGNSWAPVGGGVAGGVNGTSVNAIVPKGGSLYVGGNFDTAGGITVNNIARWDGNSWFPLGSGTGGGRSLALRAVRAIAFSGTEMYIGGDFTTAGGKVSSRIAHWSLGGVAPTIDSATFNGIKVLIIRGTNFTGSVHVDINGVDRTDFVRSQTDASIKIKGKAAALGLHPGANTIQISIPLGAISNTYVLNL